METIASRYRLLENIGSGGEARVFRAHDLVAGMDVAVRLPPPGEAHGTIHEIPTYHPGWVRLLDRGTDREHGPYTVFELLRGKTLGALVRHRPFLPDAWLEFVRQSLEAIEALHHAGWVHGDLNADNFLLDAGVKWKLLDLPFQHAEPVKNRSPLFGSIYTLAPEQFGGQMAALRSDIYALGCLYYYAACGRYPHADGNEAEIAVGRLRFPAEPLHERAPSLSRTMASWVMRLLEREPDDRPASASEAWRLLDIKRYSS